MPARRRPAIGDRAADRDPAPSAVTVELSPTSTVHGSHCALTVSGRFAGAAAAGRRRRRRRWRWRRRHVDAHAGVIADAHLPVVVVARTAWSSREAQICAPASARSSSAPRREESLLALHRHPDRRPGQTLGVAMTGSGDERAVVRRPARPPVMVTVSLDGTTPFISAVMRMKLREGNPTPAPQRNAPPGASKPSGLPRNSYPPIARPFDELREFLAHDEVERAVQLARAVARRPCPPSALQQAADGQRRRLLLRPRTGGSPWRPGRSRPCGRRSRAGAPTDSDRRRRPTVWSLRKSGPVSRSIRVSNRKEPKISARFAMPTPKVPATSPTLV